MGALWYVGFWQLLSLVAGIIYTGCAFCDRGGGELGLGLSLCLGSTGWVAGLIRFAGFMWFAGLEWFDLLAWFDFILFWFSGLVWFWFAGLVLTWFDLVCFGLIVIFIMIWLIDWIDWLIWFAGLICWYDSIELICWYCFIWFDCICSFYLFVPFDGIFWHDLVYSFDLLVQL